MRIFGSSGSRGIVNEELTPEFVLRIGTAAGALWRAENQADRVAIGHDTRTSAEMFVSAAASGASSVGLDVDLLGVVPTPSLQAYAAREGVPAMMITASHNPPPHNGLKLIGPDGLELDRSHLERVEERLLADTVDRATWDSVGRISPVPGANDTYVEELLGAVDTEAIAEANLTVAIDPGHGAGGLTTPRLFRELGCEVLTVNDDPDGHFPGRNPEPVERHLSDLSELVATSEADLGIAHDGDADRAIFVDETGAFVEGDAALAALSADTLQPGDAIVSAISASQRLVDVAEASGAEIHLTPIGSTHLVTKIQSLQDTGTAVPIAGEGNGGIIFPGYRTVRDGAYAGVRFCELLLDQTVSECVAPFDEYENVRHNVQYDSDVEREAMTDAIAAMARDSEAEIDRTDGYRLEYDDGWVLVRPSGTEHLIRVYAESPSADRAEALVSQVVETVEGARKSA